MIILLNKKIKYVDALHASECKDTKASSRARGKMDIVQKTNFD